MIKKIVFVYNAHSGVLAAMLDSARKAAGSEEACSLCSITHGLFAEKSSWEEIERSLPVPAEYFHRDDLPGPVNDFLRAAGAELPVVLFEKSAGGYELAVASDALKACRGGPECLQGELETALTKHANP